MKLAITTKAMPVRLLALFCPITKARRMWGGHVPQASASLEIGRTFGEKGFDTAMQIIGIENLLLDGGRQ